MKKETVEYGQTWRDLDRRREQGGYLRTFRVTRVQEFTIECRDVKTDKVHSFKRRRFGSGAANDSFVLVGAAEGKL
jgi:hypothetical protein